MKLFTILFSIFLANISLAKAKIIIISDLDDTIRQVNVSEIEEAIATVSAERSGLITIPKFEGLNKVYNDINKNHSTDFYYLSASYPFIYNAQEWIENNNFPNGTVLQRGSGDEFNSGEFKRRILRNIIGKYQDESDEIIFLFFGDNGEHDPETYEFIVKEAGIAENSHIFIRDVVTDASFIYPDSRSLKDNIFYFLTEKQLLNSDLMNFITPYVQEELSSQTILDIPAFMIDNLDERYEDNVCELIPFYYFRSKIRCSYRSGNEARKMISELLNQL